MSQQEVWKGNRPTNILVNSVFGQTAEPKSKIWMVVSQIILRETAWLADSEKLQALDRTDG